MSAPCTLPERLAVLLAKEFGDGEVGFTGLGTGRAAAVYITGIPLAAMSLAQRTHAPNLTCYSLAGRIIPIYRSCMGCPSWNSTSGCAIFPVRHSQSTIPGITC